MSNVTTKLSLRGAEATKQSREDLDDIIFLGKNFCDPTGLLRLDKSRLAMTFSFIINDF